MIVLVHGAWRLSFLDCCCVVGCSLSCWRFVLITESAVAPLSQLTKCGMWPE